MAGGVLYLLFRCGLCAESCVASVLTCETGLVMATARRCWQGWNEVVGPAVSRCSSRRKQPAPYSSVQAWGVGPRAWAQEPKPWVAIARA